MQGFDFLFEGFTLLLGLAVAEVLSGFAGMLKLRARLRRPRIHGEDAVPENSEMRFGFLLPFLAVITLLHLSTFWIDMFQLRERLPFNLLSVTCVLGIVGGYYLIASLLFPEEPERWPDFDAYFFAHRRLIVFSLLGLSLLGQVGLVLAGIDWPETNTPARLQWLDDLDTAGDLVSFGALVAAAIVRSKWVCTWLLAAVVVSFGIAATASALGVGAYVAA